MYPGNPLLAFYDIEGTVRTYEYTNGRLVALGLLGGFAPANSAANQQGPRPFIGWLRDRIGFVNSFATGSTGRQVRIYDPTLANLIFSVTETYDTIASAVNWRASFSRRNGFMAAPALGGAANCIGPVDMENTPPYTASNAFSGIPAGLNSAAYNADATRMAIGGSSETTFLRQGPLTLQDFVAVARPSTMQAWCSAGQHCVIAQSGESEAYVYKMTPLEDAAGVTETYVITTPAPIVSMASCTSRRILAIGTVSGGAYTTYVYRRVGDFYQLTHTITGLGKELTMGADSRLLIDVAQRKVFDYLPDFNDWYETPLASNDIPTGGVFGVLSNHANLPEGLSTLYQNAVDTLFNEGLQALDLRFTLMTSEAPAFDQNATDLASVIGTAEVATGGWPAGGLALTGISATDEAGATIRIDIDEASHVVIVTPMEFRYGVLYNATPGGNVPLVHYDFVEDFVIPRSSRIRFNPTELGLLQIGG